MRRFRLLVMFAATWAVASLLLASPAAAMDDIPGESPSYYTWTPVTLDGANAASNHAVFRSGDLYAYDELKAYSKYGFLGFDLFAPGSTSVDLNTPLNARSTDMWGFPCISYIAPASGTYYFDAWAPSSVGSISDEVQLQLRRYMRYKVGGPATEVVSYGETGGIEANMYTYDLTGQWSFPVPYLVYRSVAGGPWTREATKQGQEGENNSFYEPVKVKTAYRMITPANDYSQATTSTVKTIYPKARLTRSSSWHDTTKYDGRAYYYKGYIEPRHSSKDGKVKFKLYKRGVDGVYDWKKTVTASYSYYSSSKTRWTARVVFPSAGTWRMRAYHARDSKNWASYSSYDYVKVK